jgi:hypothetical protein
MEIGKIGISLIAFLSGSYLVFSGIKENSCFGRSINRAARMALKWALGGSLMLFSGLFVFIEGLDLLSLMVFPVLLGLVVFVRIFFRQFFWGYTLDYVFNRKRFERRYKEKMELMQQ